MSISSGSKTWPDREDCEPLTQSPLADEWRQALADANGDADAAAQAIIRSRVAAREEANRSLPPGHPDRPPPHPDDDGWPPEGGTREPRRPLPSAPSDGMELTELTEPSEPDTTM